jgi:SAM-dependent methyltransferase
MLSPRFRSTVPHYVAGRPNYGPALILIVKQHLRLTDRHRLLDLGCGPGWLGIAFAPFVGSVLAVDPEPAMLEAASALAAEANVRIDLMEGSSYDLDPQLGMFDDHDDRTSLSLDGSRCRPAQTGRVDRAGRRIESARSTKRSNGTTRCSIAPILKS